MGDTESDGRVIRRLRLRADQKPLPMFVDGSSEPLSPEWLAVVEYETARGEEFLLVFADDDGRWLTWLQFDTLQIALDQASDLLGAAPGAHSTNEDWEVVDLSESDEGFGRWDPSPSA